MEVLSGPCFPRLPQEAQNGLCKANGLCEKQVRRCVGQGVAEDGLCTEEGKWLVLCSAYCWQVSRGNETIPGIKTGEEGFPFLYFANKKNNFCTYSRSE